MEEKKMLDLGYILTNEEMTAILNYLSQKPWAEVNQLMSLLIQKVQPKTEQ